MRGFILAPLILTNFQNSDHPVDTTNKPGPQSLVTNTRATQLNVPKFSDQT